jgi:hypothetical protein
MRPYVIAIIALLGLVVRAATAHAGASVEIVQNVGGFRPDGGSIGRPTVETNAGRRNPNP